MNKTELLNTLKPFNEVIQVCPVCGKVDVYLHDGHSCSDYLDNEESRNYLYDE